MNSSNTATSTETNTLTFHITGMDCAGCAQSLQTAVGRMDGVDRCELSFTTERMHVTGPVDRDAVIACVRELGYDVADPTAAADDADTHNARDSFWRFMWQRGDMRLVLLAVLFILPGVILAEILGRHALWIDASSLVALALAGGPIARSAWRTLVRQREININVLMTIAASGAVFIGAYTEAGMVMVLFALGEALEGYTTGRARHAIRSLMDVAPRTAVKLQRENGRMAEHTIDVDDLAIGDWILVKPGERIPMDGTVRAGASAVNQAAITGESRPIDKRNGDEVFAGSVNGEGALQIEVTKRVEDNTISRVIQMVEEAQERRAPAQRFVDRFARYYTPAVVVLAVLVATVPPLLFGQPFLNPGDGTFGWLYRGLALLVVACPCALVISTPVSVISAITNAARHGVLFKGGAFVEMLSGVQAVAFDKTGTLTQGAPSVITVHAANCTDKMQLGRDACQTCDEVLALASAVERHSEHPLARAVVAASTTRNLHDVYPPAETVTALTGQGVTGRVHGRQVTVGSHSYFDEQNILHANERCDAAQEDAQRGYTPILVSADGDYMGTITVADAVRSSSRAAVDELKALGISSIVMLTGDHTATAHAIAEQVGVTDVRAELLPEQKVDAIQDIERTYGPTAMVGDGINDAPALALASVGIAAGGATATAQAMETADVTLMSADLRQLPFALRVSRAAMRTIHVNVALSIGIKLVFLVLVLFGLGTMWMAVLADMGTSLLVTLNGMRLLRRPVYEIAADPGTPDQPTDAYPRHSTRTQSRQVSDALE